MHLEKLGDFIEEGHSGVYRVINEQVLSAVNSSQDKGIMPETFRLPENMAGRKIFELEESLRDMGFDPRHKYTKSQSGTGLYLIVPPKSEQH